MKVTQYIWTPETAWKPFDVRSETPGSPQLILVFAGIQLLANGVCVNQLRRKFPDANVVGCSTAGEIIGRQVMDDTAVATAIEFSDTMIKTAQVRVKDAGSSAAAGRQLAKALAAPGLTHVLVFSDGLAVNGSELAHGMSAALPPEVAITGGLSGDSAEFKRTLVVVNETVEEGMIAAVGLYGSKLQVGYGSTGGWQPFGPERRVTRSKGNVLYELDGQSALALYKTYLGKHAEELPASGLLFPLGLSGGAGTTGVVRTILAVDESQQSLTFAGDVPEGVVVRLMRAGPERLVEGAIAAARTAVPQASREATQLALLVSCVGRKLVLKQRTEEEVEGVQSVFGDETAMTGFYSFGELCPFGPGSVCELHNQTMTITTLSEI